MLLGEIRVVDLDPETHVRMDAKAQDEQVRWVTVERVGPVVGQVPRRLMAAVDDALRLHLQL